MHAIMELHENFPPIRGYAQVVFVKFLGSGGPKFSTNPGKFCPLGLHSHLKILRLDKVSGSSVDWAKGVAGIKYFLRHRSPSASLRQWNSRLCPSGQSDHPKFQRSLCGPQSRDGRGGKILLFKFS